MFRLGGTWLGQAWKPKGDRMKYEWLVNRDRFPVDAQVAGEALAKLVSLHGGKLTPEVVVNAARPKTAPLHKCFEWNDERAAELHRRAEAAKLIRSVRVKRENAEGEARVVRAFVPAKDETGAHFKSASVVTRSEQLRTAINVALDNLTAAREKLEPYQEVGKWCEGVKGCEADVKAVRDAAKKVCAKLEQIEEGLVEQLMPPKHQSVRDERRLVAI